MRPKRAQISSECAQNFANSVPAAKQISSLLSHTDVLLTPWNQSSYSPSLCVHKSSDFTLSFSGGTTTHRPNSVLLFSATANPALIRRTSAEDLLSIRPGSPHYHIMQNSALVSSSDLIISLFSCY